MFYSQLQHIKACGPGTFTICTLAFYCYFRSSWKKIFWVRQRRMKSSRKWGISSAERCSVGNLVFCSFWKTQGFRLHLPKSGSPTDTKVKVGRGTWLHLRMKIVVFTRIFQIQISNKDYLGDSADDGDEDDEDALGHDVIKDRDGSSEMRLFIRRESTLLIFLKNSQQIWFWGFWRFTEFSNLIFLNSFSELDTKDWSVYKQ